MPIPSDDDVDLLIYQLAASLPPPQYSAFIAAAHRALAGIPHLGPGLAYRVLRELQRHHFHPLPDQRIGQSRFGVRRPSKLLNAEPIGPTRPDRARRALWSGG
jgi:hypothetical protein